MPTSQSGVVKLLPDEERSVDDLLASLLSGRKGEKITSVQELVEAICRRKRDLDEDAVIRYLGVLTRRGELRMNGSHKAPSFQFVPPGTSAPDVCARAGRKSVTDASTTLEAGASRAPSVAFAQLSKRGKLTGQLRKEFDHLLLMDLERRGEEILFHPWILELPRRYPRLCNTAGRTVFSYSRVYGTVLRLAEQGAVTMKKDNNRWRVRAIKRVAGSEAISALHDRPASAPAGVSTEKLAELKDLERRRDQIMEELARLVQRLESLRFDLYCQAIAVVARESSQ